MKDIIDKVVSFNKDILGIEQRKPGIMGLNEHVITVKCLHEEIQEYVDAYATFSLLEVDVKAEEQEAVVAEMTDAFVDLIYFGIGAMYKLGLTADQIRRSMDAVHECNVTKKLGKNAKRDTGAADAVKPENWVGPEEKILAIVKETI